MNARPRSRWRRLLRGALLFVALSVLTLVGFARWGRLLEASAESWLESTLGGQARVERIELSLTRGCSVFGLSLRADDAAETAPYLVIEEANLLFKTLPGSQLIGVSIEGLELTVTEHEGGIHPRWLLAESPGTDRQPRVEIRSGRFRFVGEGPIHEQIHAYLNDPTALQVDVRRLELIPRDDGQRFELRGSLRPPVGPLTHFEGEGRQRLDWIRFHLDRDEPLDLSNEAVRDRLAPPIREWLDENHIDGQVVYTGKLEGLAEVSALEDLLGRLEVDIELMRMSVRPEAFPCLLEDLRGRLTLQGRDLVLSGLQAQHHGARALIEGEIRDLPGRQEMELRSRVSEVSLTAELQRALAQTVGRDFLDAFRPEGRFDITTRVQLGFDEEERAQTSVWNDIEMKDVEMCYHGYPGEGGTRRYGFPLPLKNVRGKMTAGPDDLQWKDVVARTHSGAVVRTNGDLRWEGKWPSGQVSVTALDLPLDEAFLSACTAAIGPEADEFARALGIGGNADLEFRLELVDGDVAEDGLSVVLVPRRVSVRHGNFPLPIQFNEGRVEYRGGRVALRVHGWVEPRPRERPGGAVVLSADDAGRVQVEGWIDPDSSDLSLQFRGQEVALSEDFRQACSTISDQGTESLFEDLRPSGAVELVVDWISVEPELRDEVLIQIHPLAARLDPPALGVPVEHLIGRAQVRSEVEGEWVVTVPAQGGLEGQALEGRIGFTGTVRTDPSIEGYRGKITLDAERLRVRGSKGEAGPHLFSALDRSAPQLAGILRPLSPSGWLRSRASLEWSEGEWSLAHLDFGPDLPRQLDTAGLHDRDGIHLYLPLLQRTLIWKGGTISGNVGEGLWRFPQLDAVLENSQVTLLEGRAEWGEEAVRITYRGRLGALSVDQLVAPFLPDGTGSWRTTGTTHTELTDMLVEIPHDRPGARSIIARAVVDLSRCGLRSSTGSHTLDGNLELQVEYRDDEHDNPGRRLFGKLEEATLSIAGTEVQNLSASVDLRGDRLSISRLTGEYAGGRLHVVGARPFEVPLDGSEPYTGHLILQGADLSRLLGDDNEICKDLQGRVRLELTVQGRGSDPRRFTATGLMNVTKGELWSIPVFDRLYEARIGQLLGQTEPPRFEEGTMHFRFQDGIFFITDLHMQGSSLSVDGRGALGPERLHMHLQPVLELPLMLPLVGPLIQDVFSTTQRKTLSFRFEGPYGDPSSRYDLVPPDRIEDFARGLDQPRLSHPPPPAIPRRF